MSLRRRGVYQDDKMQLLNKMSMKAIGCQPKKSDAPVTGQKYLCTIFGRATGYTLGQSNFGEWVRFLGSFEARANGEIFTSAKLHLPNVVSDSLQVALDMRDDDAMPIEFAFDFFVEKADTAIGYAYAAKTVIETKTHDELSALRAAVESKSFPALGAPVADNAAENTHDKKKGGKKTE